MANENETAAQTNAAKPYEFPFSRELFVGAFDEIKPLLLQEWPELDERALDKTDGDPDEVVDVVTSSTKHSRALVRQHLSEIAEIAGIDAANLEQRLVRLIHLLERKAEPMQTTVRQTRERATRIARDMGAEGQHLVEGVRETVPKAEEKMKENIWTTLLASLGVGLLVGLVVGLSNRGR